jgi:AraC-like DNA-binding protein
MDKILEYHSGTLIDKEASIHIFSANHLSFPAHTHDFIEIIYVKSGKAIQKVNGTSYEVGEGDLLFINYGAHHEYISNDGYSFVNICFHPETFSDGIVTRENAFAVLQLTAFDEIRGESDNGTVSFKGESRIKLERILDDMLCEYNSRKKGWHDAIKSYMNLLLIEVLRKLSVEGESDGEVGIWRSISAYIDANLGMDLSLSALAEKCFYNPSYFSRSFKERFGITLVEYVTRSRTEAAARLLCESELSTEEIAVKCGFGDRTALYRAFSKQYGMTPREWREQKK